MLGNFYFQVAHIKSKRKIFTPVSNLIRPCIEKTTVAEAEDEPNLSLTNFEYVFSFHFRKFKFRNLLLLKKYFLTKYLI